MQMGCTLWVCRYFVNKFNEEKLHEAANAIGATLIVLGVNVAEEYVSRHMSAERLLFPSATFRHWRSHIEDHPVQLSVFVDEKEDKAKAQQQIDLWKQKIETILVFKLDKWQEQEFISLAK